MRFQFLTVLGLLTAIASPAAAEDIRFPATFKPALMIHTPKGWTSEIQKSLLSDNLIIQSDDSTMVLVFSLVPTLGSVDKIAAKVLQQTPLSKAPGKFAGLNATVYRGKATNPEGLKLNQKLFIAPIDPQEGYSCTLITSLDDNDPRLAPANAVIVGLKLLPK